MDEPSQKGHFQSRDDLKKYETVWHNHVYQPAWNELWTKVSHMYQSIIWSRAGGSKFILVWTFSTDTCVKRMCNSLAAPAYCVCLLVARRVLSSLCLLPATLWIHLSYVNLN